MWAQLDSLTTDSLRSDDYPHLPIKWMSNRELWLRGVAWRYAEIEGVVVIRVRIRGRGIACGERGGDRFIEGGFPNLPLLVRRVEMSIFGWVD